MNDGVVVEGVIGGSGERINREILREENELES